MSGEWFLSHPGQPPSAIYGAMLQACRQAGFLPRVRQEVKETATLVALVAAGLGVALVPASVQRLHLGGTAYRPLAPPCPEVALALAYREGEVSPLLRRFLETTRSVIRSRERPPVRNPAQSRPDDDGFFELTI